MLVVKVDTHQFENADDSGQIHFLVGLESAMRDNGLIEFVKSPDGTVSPIPNVLERPSSHLINIVNEEIQESNMGDVNERLPKIISELQMREAIINSLKEPAPGHYQLPTPAQEEYPALRTVDMNMPNISDAEDALLQRIDLAIERNDYQALRSLSSIIQRLQGSLRLSQTLAAADRR